MVRSQALACLRLRAREWLRGCNVGQFELHPLLALPAINGKATGGMDLPAAAVAQRNSELLAHGAKCNGIHGGPVAGFQPQAHMRLTHFFGASDGVRRQRDDRLRIAGAEWPSP